MINIKLLITYKKDLEYVNEFHGLVIFCKDTKETYYVNQYLNKVDISLNTIFMKSKSGLDSVISPILSRIYIVEDTNEIYKYTNKWVLIETEEKLLDIVETSVDYMPGVIFQDDKFYAPKTLASAVYMNDGSRLSASLDSNLLTVTKTKAIYVEAEVNRQRVFNIPYPISGYDLCRNHVSVILRGGLLETNKYVINNNKLILNTNVQPLQQGELLLFIFYYTVVLDLNENVVLTTKNYEDRSITTEKLAEDIAIKATNILETPRRYFMTPEEKEKLNGVDYGATRYIHPETHPASMIVEDDNRMFIPKKKLEELDMKAFSRDVYTKTETTELLTELFNKIVGASPETLDTLHEIAEALGNDPNFATTILNKLSKKAEITEIERIDEELEKKVSITDYLRAGIYGTPVKTTIYDIDHYRISVKDALLKEYIDGMPVSIKIAETNKGPCMLQINGLDPKPILTQDQYPLLKGELKVGSIYNVRYNGSTGNFILQGKGGVNLNDSTQTEYIVDNNESIIRGDLLDLVNGKVRRSVPRCSLVSNYIPNNTNFECNGKIRLVTLDNNKFVVVWKEDKILKAYLFNITELDMFINNNVVTQEPMIVNLECIDFEVTKIDNEKIVIHYNNDLYNLHSLIVNINNDELVPGSIRSFQESYHIFNIRAIKIKDNRYILGYQFDDKTTLMYTRVVDDTIEILSTRTNVDYIIDSYCFVNESQLLFAGPVNNIIRAWVMNINDLDFNYTTLSTVATGEEDSLYSTLRFTLVGERRVYFTYTKQNMTVQYEQYIELDFNGDIIAYPSAILTEDVDEIRNNIIEKRIELQDKYYVSVSNYDMSRPGDSNNKQYMKIILQKMENSSVTNINKYSIIPNKYQEIAYEMINKNKLLIVFSSKNNEAEQSRLFFYIVEVKKKPDMVAMSNGITGDTVKVSEW